MASRPSKPKIHNPSSSTTTFPKYAETYFLTHRRRNRKSPIGVLSVGDDWNDSGLVNHDASSMVPLPTEASINWNVNSDDKSGCSDRNFTSSSEEVEASLSWLLNAQSDGVEDEVSTMAFVNYASTYFPMETTHRRRNSKPPRGVLSPPLALVLKMIMLLCYLYLLKLQSIGFNEEIRSTTRPRCGF